MNPNPLSVFRLIVPVIDAIRDTFSTPCVSELGADEYHTFRCLRSGSSRRNQAGPPASPGQAGVSIAATRLLLRRALFGACALSHDGRHVDRSWTRMLLGDVRGEAVRRGLLAAEPAEGLAGRDVDALHDITSIG
jgi:hypothetical protein